MSYLNFSQYSFFIPFYRFEKNFLFNISGNFANFTRTFILSDDPCIRKKFLIYLIRFCAADTGHKKKLNNNVVVCSSLQSAGLIYKTIKFPR